MFPITSYTTKQQQQQQRLQRPHRYRSCCWFWMSPLLGKDLNKSEHLWDPPSFMLVLLTRLDEPIHLVWYLSLDLPSIVVPTYFSSCGHLNTKASLQSRGSVSLAIIFLYTHYQKHSIFFSPMTNQTSARRSFDKVPQEAVFPTTARITRFTHIFPET